MTVLKVYEYAKCSTCIRAFKFLTNARYAMVRVDIFTTPPTKEELRRMLAIVGDKRKLFNTSGHVYKEMGLTAKIPSMTDDEAIDLLASNGRLVRRPFVLWGDTGVVGFDPELWKKTFK
jgi:arsenate reductase (glutaredoxin)